MTIYNFNMGIGWASSGVEYAQAYRSQVFNALGIDTRFVFTDLILNENIQHLTANIGLLDHQVIWLYQAFSDIPYQACSVTVQQVLDSLTQSPVRWERNDQVLRYYFNETGDFVTLYLIQNSDTVVHRAEFVSNNCLIRKDYYAHVRYASEYFVPEDNKAMVYNRRFFNLDGSVALEEFVRGEESVYKVGHHLMHSKADLVEFFIQSLPLTGEDILIIDRSTDIAAPVFKMHGPAKVGIVVHADHYSKASTNAQQILWNNYYEYVFSNMSEIDFVICATKAQTETLQAHFATYTEHRPNIYTIPVGNLASLKGQTCQRKAYSLITASRLAQEKHIDLLVDAVVQAHESLPHLTLDIYGMGGEQEALSQQIEKRQAQDYIQLKGHHQLDDVYDHYELYLTASMSEGFGLTLMEAVGSGLAMIGFDVPYGNPTFIQDGQNGFLLPVEGLSRSEKVTAMSEAIEKYYRGDRQAFRQAFRQASYHIAEQFTLSHLKTLWQALIEEVGHV